MTQTGTNRGKTVDWLKTLASPAVLFYALPWLIVLLVLGTVAQKDLGLYAAQAKYFSSWILWWGPFPLPGAYITLGVITVCLLAKFLLYSPWRAAQAGTILTHLGVLVLMIGGLVTALSQQEGFLPVSEGQTVSMVSSYHDRVLRIEKDGAVFMDVPYAGLKKGAALELPFTVKIENLCRNCHPVATDDIAGRKGLAESIELREGEVEKEDEANLSGATLLFSGTSEEDGTYVVMEEIPHKPEVTFEGSVYAFSLGRAQQELPFSLTLVKFSRDMHPGTDIPSGFSSSVIVRDGDVSWPYTIRMNEPLRYKGYTFYQSSFSIRPDGEYSILSVVRNKGRVFPYLASAIIFAGLLVHIVLRLRPRRRTG